MVILAPRILQELKFKGIGNITIFHLMKNLGLDIFKPNLHVCRLLERVGLIGSKTPILQIYSVMATIAEENRLKAKELDTLLFIVWQNNVRPNTRISMKVDTLPKFGFNQRYSYIFFLQRHGC